MSGPLCLVVETSSRAGVVGLACRGVVLDREPVGDPADARPRQVGLLLPAIDTLCRRAGVRPAQIEQVHPSVGPGGFTGTRLAVTLAKTLVAVSGCRVVAVPTPAVVVRNVDAADASDVLFVADARRGMIWAEHFEGGRSVRRFGTTVPAAALGATPRPLLCLGEGVAYHADALAADGVALAPPEAAVPSLDAAAAVGHELASADAFADPAALVPTYVREPDAAT